MTNTFQCEGGCGREIKDFPRRKTRFCRSCIGTVNGQDRAKVEKARASMKKRMQDPAFKAEHIRRTSEGLRARLASDPDEAARRREAGRALGKSGLGHAAQGAGSEPRIRVGRMQTERYLGWCPMHLRDQYRDLVNKKGVPALEARQIIEQQIAADQAKLTPFERQLKLIREGKATVAPKFKPTTDTGPYTLGGVASGMI
ncbi:hypothetical protein NUH86_10885 [Sphingobium sp. JS3065]|uniref:hypothetical protein n=1 Tax=Sphingobium sp. JS3065 TaxID=2970925 RepID=UPI0022652E0F|nr:hypothetical protein [Sphingobium sp. JS3065]UZW54040.1 hypothetical protein NUH86_10885 [Sphingobium sp. JS3065]